MGYPLGGLYLPSSTAYRKKRTINRTNFGSYLVLQDPQTRLPAAWCSLCGSEVYRPGRIRCSRCTRYRNG